MADMEFHVVTMMMCQIKERLVLALQHPNNTLATLFMITMVDDSNSSIDFFLRSDNLYIIAHTNKNSYLRVQALRYERYRMSSIMFLMFGMMYFDLFLFYFIFGDEIPRFIWIVGAHGLLNIKVNKDQVTIYLTILARVRASKHHLLPLVFLVLVLTTAEDFTTLHEGICTQPKMIISLCGMVISFGVKLNRSSE